MNDVRSPEEIEREINELRAQISDTLDAVQRKLSPGQILDQALSYARDGGEFAARIGRGMRDNPIPASLFGLSLGWLWYAGSRGDRAAPSHDDVIEAHDSLEPADDELRDELLHARDATLGYVRTNPLTTAGVALMAGALIGALWPRRRR
jgi:ElaB/YqjD/DUF883 family membrane-anchored ribosome-binding protein